jgi:putative addiction module CopG family antidote
MAQMVKTKVSSGEYATESEVIRDGLRSLLARDAAIESWLRDDVVPTYDAIKAGTMPVETAEQTRDFLNAHMNVATDKKVR